VLRAAAALLGSLCRTMGESLAGQLLLAAPNLADPNFARTVVLIGVHSSEGAMGLVLNRPSELTVGEAVPELEGAVAREEPLYLGGPVQTSAIVCLAEFLDPAGAGLLVLGRIGFPSRDTDLASLSDSTGRTRAFAGFAGWGEGQLEGEISDGDWIAAAALAEDVFTDSPADLWSRALVRKGGSFALLARMPLDPSMN
jgi:putative transcriptional regulator